MSNQTPFPYLLFEFTSIDSTQDEVKRRLLNHDIDPDIALVVRAQEQTQGRGRQKRRWISPHGKNIYMSLALPLPAPLLTQPTLLCPAVCLAVHDYFSSFTCTHIKWPNDILIKGKKAAGILIETVSIPSRDEKSPKTTTTYGVIGVGINLNMTVEECLSVKEREITSIFAETGIQNNIESETRRLIDKILNLLARDSHELTLVLYEWLHKLSWMIGMEITTHGRDGILRRGVVEEFTREGLLVIKDPLTGKEEIVASGL